MPEAIGHGKFSVYQENDGSYHIAYRFDGDDETRHATIPAALVRIAEKASGGQVNIASMLKLKVPR
jgi:hypothetical protein